MPSVAPRASLPVTLGISIPAVKGTASGTHWPSQRRLQPWSRPWQSHKARRHSQMRQQRSTASKAVCYRYDGVFFYAAIERQQQYVVPPADWTEDRHNLGCNGNHVTRSPSICSRQLGSSHTYRHSASTLQRKGKRMVHSMETAVHLGAGEGGTSAPLSAQQVPGECRSPLLVCFGRENPAGGVTFMFL